MQTPSYFPILSQAIQALKQGDLPETERLCREILNAHSTAHETMQVLATVVAKDGRGEEAIELLKRAVAIEARPEYLNTLGEIQRTMGLHSDALLSLQKALRINPKYTKAYFNLGKTLKGIDAHGDAEKAFREVIRFNPKHSRAYLNLGQVLQMQGYMEQAVKNYEHALRLSPDDANTLSIVAAQYDQANRPDESRDLVDRGLAIDPDHPGLTLLYAKLERRKGEYVQSLERLESLLKRKQDAVDYPGFMNEVGMLHDLNGDADAAFKAFERAAEVMRGISTMLSIDMEAFPKRIDLLRESITPSSTAAWAALPELDDGYADPVFLVGFPCSGTTLLSRIINRHSTIKSVEEKHVIQVLVRQLTVEKSYPSCLATLSAEDVAAL
ncbi:MAG: tetratricopeptide repeat protein, partial [Magnetococcales bacterium]|nr:tetratricopeptide repeat protein [Magnetococcales bacterium]